MPTNKTHPQRRTAQAWARIVAAWQKSGKSIGEFAVAHGIAPRTLSWWKWRLASKSPPASPAPLRLVPVHIEPSPPTTPAPPEAAIPAWEIVTARGHVLRVHRGLAGAELAAVLAALELTEGRR